MIEVGKNAGDYFERHRSEGDGRYEYSLKSRQQYALEHGCKEPPSKRYFQAAPLLETIRSYPLGGKRSLADRELERGLHVWIATSKHTQVKSPSRIKKKQRCKTGRRSRTLWRACFG